MDDFVVAVAQIGAVNRDPLVGFDDDCPRADPDAGLHQLKIIVGADADVGVGMDVHVNDALHGNLGHTVSPFTSQFSDSFLPFG